MRKQREIFCEANTSFSNSGEIISRGEMSSFEFTFPEPEDSIQGGYDYEFVGDTPSSAYTCLICTLVAREAQQASCCGKIFCKQCLKGSMRQVFSRQESNS